jgi:hypothetical protein
MYDNDIPSDFEKTIGDFGFWALVVGLLIWIYKTDEGRFVGWIIGICILLIAIYREVFTFFPSGSYFASALVILGTCYASSNKDI